MSDIFDNYIKLFLIIRGPATQALRASMTYYLRKCCLTFQEFIDSNQHEIYHLHTDRRCCQCTGQPFFGDKTPLQMAQMKKMFDTSSQITSKRKNNHDYRKKDMCCCYANCQICVDDVDITLLRILLNKFCNIFFWTCYLDMEHSGNFEQFLKNRRHEIFHLWQPGITCCKCNEHKSTYKRPKISEINQHEFERLYTIDRTIKAVECTLNDTCTYSARKGISQVDIKGTKLFKTITDRFCSPQKEINSIVETRNDFSHSTDLTEEEFKKCWSTLRDNIEKIESMTESKLWTEESIDKLEQKLDLKILLNEIKTDLGNSIWNEKHSHEILQKQIEQMKSELKNLFQRSREKNPAQSFTSLSHKNYTESSICLHPKQFKLKLLKLYKEIDCETEEAEKRLKENCRHLNLTFQNETPRNGNCFFDAVSSQMRDLGLRERSAEEIRENVIDYLMENRNFQGVDGDVNIEHFIDDSTFEDWARNMRTNGVFADHVVVLGMARMLETNMLIITSNPQTNPENCMTHIVGKMDYNRMPIILGHVWESHYYSLISLDATRENGRLVEFCKMQARNHRHSPLGICTAALNKMELDTSPSNYEVTSADIYMTLKARTVTREMKIEGKGEVFAPDDREIEIPCSSSISPMSYANGDGDSDCDDDLFGCGKCGKHFTTYESFVTHKKENIQCTQRKRKNIKKSTDTLGISSEQKWNMTPGEPNEKRIMLKIRMQQTPGEMEPAWKHYVKQVQRTCTGNLDVDEDIIVEYIEDGSLVFWSKTNTSTVQNKAKFAEIMDRFMVNLFQKCPIDTEDETKFSFSVDVVEAAEDEDNDDEDENDVFICGRCGITFKSFSSFTNHKSNINLCCKKNRTDQQHKDDCSNSIKTQRTLDTFDESEQSIKMIKVSNIPTGSSEESIRIFFKNKQNFEGGDIQDFDYDEDSHTAIFTFEEKDAIKAVMSKNLRVDGQTLNANRYVPSPPPNPVPKYDDKVFIKNISPTTTEDGLEVKSKCIPKELIFGEAESTVLATFEQQPDIAEEIEQNIPAGSSEESIKYVSAKVRRSAVGDIEDFDYNEDNHTAIVTFEKDAQQNLQIPQIMSKEETLKQIFNLLQTNIHAYMRSSDQYIEMRERRVRRSRTMKASSCPPNTQNTKYYKDQGTCVTPPESPTECKCLCHCEQSSGLRGIFSSHKVVPDVCVFYNNENLPDQKIFTKPDSSLPEGVNTKNEGKEDAEICSRSQKCPSSPDTENSDSIECNIVEQQLSLMRENIDLKIQMQEVQKHIKGLRKDKDDDESMNQHLISIDDILSKVLCTQKCSEIMCDKLCEGLSRVKDKGKQLPAELKEFCDSIRKTVGQDYRQIGSELGIEPDILTHIEDEYSEAEECLHQIILEWSKRTEMPSYHALVTACYNVNSDILKCKPLEEKKATLLERSYSMMCDEMLEIPLLPHLISSGVVSLKMQRYILQPKTRDQRICRLLSILKTRQNGFEALLSALDLSDQSHISNSLKSLERQTGETLTQVEVPFTEDNEAGKMKQPEVPCTEDDGAGKMTQPCFLRPKRFPSCESLDSDDNKGSAFDILMKIQDIITQAVFPDRLTP